MKQEKRDFNLFIGCFNKSVWMTYIGVIFSITGILNLLESSIYESINRVDIAMICLMLAGICDMLDGFIARKCKRNEVQKAFGVQLDSLCDVISFVIFPIILFYYMQHVHNDFTFIIMCLYGICGVNRLAWFNATVDSFDGYFRGIPVTYSAIILPAVYATLGYTSSVLQMILPWLYILTAIGFSINVKVAKPTPKFYGVFVILMILVTLAILF